jgi:hypothetical protein
MTITHTFVSPVVDQLDPDEVGPDEWNAAHTIADGTITPAQLSFPLGTGVETFLGTPSSANLASAVTGETGSGALVFGTSPSIATPAIAGATLTGAIDGSGASSLLVPTSAGYAPTANGSLGYDTTQGKWVGGGHGTITGSFVRVLSVTRPNAALTNSTTADQDYAAVFQIPANFLIAQKVLRGSFDLSLVSDGSASSIIFYIKLGATKVYTMTASTQANSVTRSVTQAFFIYGTAAPGAAVAVDVSPDGLGLTGGTLTNNTATTTHATNGALNIVPGVTWGTNTGGESLTLRNVTIMAFN